MKSMRKKAQSLIEYGLILALVAVVAATVIGKLGGSMSKAGDAASKSLDTSSNNALNKMCKQTPDPASKTGATFTKYDPDTQACGN